MKALPSRAPSHEQLIEMQSATIHGAAGARNNIEVPKVTSIQVDTLTLAKHVRKTLQARALLKPSKRSIFNPFVGLVSSIDTTRAQAHVVDG